MVRDEVVDRRGIPTARSAAAGSGRRRGGPIRIGWSGGGWCWRWRAVLLAVGREADEAEFAGATIPSPRARGPSAPGRPLASGARGRARAQARGGRGGSRPGAAAAADRDEARTWLASSVQAWRD